MLNLLKHEVVSRLGAAFGWSIGLIAFGSMYTAIFPEVGDQMSALADLSIYQAMGIDVSSFEGFIGSTVVLFIPIILGIYGIIASTYTLAGEEDDGTLEMVLAMPLHRWQIVSMKALALMIIAFLILLISALGNAFTLNLLRQTVDINITNQQLIVAVLNGWPITVAFMMIGMFLGAFAPSRRIAATILTFIFIASYFGENLAGYVASLDGMKPFSLFTYFDSSVEVFSEGVKAGDVAVLLGTGLVFFFLTIVTFQRRDVTVGMWPWQRAK